MLHYREWALSCMHCPGPSRSGSGSWVLHKETDSLGPAFCSFPGQSSSGNQELDAHTLQVQRDFSPPQSQPQFPGALVGCALCLFRGANLWLWPSRWMSTIQNLRKSLVRNWKSVCSLVGDAISGAEFAPFWPLAGARLLHASGRGLASPQPASSSLVLLSPLFCEWAGCALG